MKKTTFKHSSMTSSSAVYQAITILKDSLREWQSLSAEINTTTSYGKAF